ncbi:MAG: serine/threonine phosphatase [Gloeocapsa sp. DLM2.Bin57]|nr:MAG: serine/threonine phosphatase [Gloeocapsa sp. DLM2.Bin57]
MIIVCPHCQYTNPPEAEICEQCGTSLLEQPCFDCGTIVPFTEQNCPNCGAATGKTWWALILPPQKDNWQLTEYLDNDQRYQIITDLTSFHEDESVSVRVLDAKPLTLPDFQHSSIQVADEEATTSDSEPEEPIMTPLVELYLELRDKLPDLIPAIHDHWLDENGEYLLLEDRSKWQNIATIKNLPNLQILTYLKQMTGLWSEFSQQQLTRTFLDPDNLYLDEDECIVLQKVSENISEHDDNLANLGKLWQSLFASSEPSLQQLYQQLIEGEITTIAQLNATIEEIESQLDLTDYGLPSLNLAFQPDSQEQEEDEDDNEILGDPTEGDNLPTLVLPMQLLSITDVAITDIGHQREHNEDYYGIVTKTSKRENPHKIKYSSRGLYIVCDGMGGHAAGEVASRMAVETLQEYFEEHWIDKLPSEEVIRQGILLTNQKIYQENLQYGRSGSGRMGTTLVMALLQDTQGAIAHVGDSRIYHITRKRGLNQLTLDHAVAQQEVLCGVEPEIAYRRHDAYQLTQAIGPRDNSCVHPEIQFLDFKEDTILFLCSDGFSDNNFLETAAKNQLLSLTSSKANLEQELRQLLELGNQHNGHDNLTAVLVRVKVQPSLERI